ncbi:cation:proton antiporter [Amycolatopsis sp. H20-H5]|uniref:cation:proton antiporter n=1 Tax=Amycolatopsis sp. H20-H5 TaxID=3046309 RepID=UPI002DBDB604|nr:cation:proton antiporter [Amycolatopsis sp. H20-H5]MEC3979801.1 cation:proton antiporter [Amycolatopsis sp. H20-H5]
MTATQSVTLLLVLAVVLMVAKAFGSLFAWWGQPAVFGEILAGILLGPTLLPAALERALYPSDIHLVLSALGNLGVALFMFLIGQEFRRHPPRKQAGAVLATTVGSVAVPFGLGVLLAVTVVRRPEGAPLNGHALLLGTAMSVTAFPVLARIIRDRDLLGTRMAGIALASAAIGDLLAWSMLAVSIMLASGRAQWRLLLVIPLLVLVFGVGRPLLAVWARWRAERGRTWEPFVVALVGLLACGAATEWLGLHFIFGAFTFGLIMPAGPGGLREPAARQMGQMTEYLLLPVYFVVVGARVDLSHLGWSGLAEFGAIMLVAVGGKVLGVMAGARLGGVDWRRSAVLATLANTRGLTELIVLSAGLQFGLLDANLYSLLVLMALITTLMTGPVLRVLYPPWLVAMDREQIEDPVSDNPAVTAGSATNSIRK